MPDATPTLPPIATATLATQAQPNAVPWLCGTIIAVCLTFLAHDVAVRYPVLPVATPTAKPLETPKPAPKVETPASLTPPAPAPAPTPAPSPAPAEVGTFDGQLFHLKDAAGNDHTDADWETLWRTVYRIDHPAK